MELGDAHRHQHLRLCEVHGSPGLDSRCRNDRRGAARLIGSHAQSCLGAQ